MMHFLGAEWQEDTIRLYFRGEEAARIMIEMDAYDLVDFEVKLGTWMDRERGKLFETMRREFARRKDFIG